MAQDWYYQLLGEETGPISFESLRDLVREGHLNSDDEVRSSDSGWMKAAQVPDLFAPGSIPEPEEATDHDLDLLLSAPSSGPTRRSSNRQGLEQAKANAARNAEEWFYKLLGQEVGPTSHDDIVEQIQLGSLQGEDLVRVGREGSWQPLSSYQQFTALLAQMKPKPEWYCRILGQVLGPMMFDELQHMAVSSSLNADDEVRFGESGPWQRAQQTRELKFQVAPATKAPVKLSTHAPFGEAARRKEWYYEILGQQLGPISFEELAKAVADGSLQLEDKARRGNTAAWGLVLNVPGLISVEQKSAYLAAKQAAARPKPVAPTAAGLAPSSTMPAPPNGPVSPGQVTPAGAIPTPAAKAPSASSSSSATPVQPPAPKPTVAATAPSLPPPSSPPRTPPPPPPMPMNRPASSAATFRPPAKRGSSGGRLKINPKILGAIVGVLLLGGAILAMPMLGISFGGQPGLKEYAKVKVIWEEAQSLQKKNAGFSDWEQFGRKHSSEVKQLEKEITDQSPGATKRLLQLMYFCTKNHLPAIMTNGDAMRYKAMERDMKEAEKLAGPVKK